jgi:hypothetical protein
MPAPTFVAEYETAVNVSTSPKTASVTTQVGDVLVVLATGENRLMTLGTPSGGTGLTWTAHPQVTNTPTSDWCTARAWTAVATTAETFNLSVARTAGDTAQFWGFIVLQWRNSGGVGSVSTSAASGAAPSRTLSCSANSAVMCIIGDWNALDTARTWRTINGSVGTEQMYVNVPGSYTAQANRWDDVGAAGTKTLGMTAPATQKYSLAAVEVLGTAGPVTGALSGSMPKVTGSGTGAVVVPGALSGVVPKVTGSGTGSVVVPGALSGSTPKVSGSGTGAVTITGAMSGSVPRLAGSMTGEVVENNDVAGSLSGSVPRLSGSMSGSVVVPGTLAGAVPKVAGSGSGAVVVPGALDGDVPVVSGALSGDVVVPGELDITLGLLAGTWHGSVPAPDPKTPWTLEIDAPVHTLVIDAPVYLLDVEAAPPRTLEVETPGYWTLEVEVLEERTLEVDAPVRTLEIDT